MKIKYLIIFLVLFSSCQKKKSDTNVSKINLFNDIEREQFVEKIKNITLNKEFFLGSFGEFSRLEQKLLLLFEEGNMKNHNEILDEIILALNTYEKSFPITNSSIRIQARLQVFKTVLLDLKHNQLSAEKKALSIKDIESLSEIFTTLKKYISTF